MKSLHVVLHANQPMVARCDMARAQWRSTRCAHTCCFAWSHRSAPIECPWPPRDSHWKVWGLLSMLLWKKEDFPSILSSINRLRIIFPTAVSKLQGGFKYWIQTNNVFDILTPSRFRVSTSAGLAGESEVNTLKGKREEVAADYLQKQQQRLRAPN